MSNRPEAQELIEAAREHLESRVLPVLDDPQLRFQTLVVAHVLRVVERELALADIQARRRWTALTALLDCDEPLPPTWSELHERIDTLNQELCARIQSGHFDEEPLGAGLLATLQQQVEDALALWNPEFLARVTADG